MSYLYSSAGGGANDLLNITIAVLSQHQSKMAFVLYRYQGMLALLTLLTTSQRDTHPWRELRLVMPTLSRSLRYQYPQLPHIATLRAGRQAEG